jgi:hypothetical protein
MSNIPNAQDDLPSAISPKFENSCRRLLSLVEYGKSALQYT